MVNGIFITLEGIEGSGKTTLINTLQERLIIPGRDIIYSREPGGTVIAERIRKLITAHDNKDMQPMTELLLMYASRSEHVATCIKPELEKGNVVISDRYYDASYAYQSGGRHIDNSILEQLDRWIVDTCVPNITFILKAPVDLCLERVFNRGNQDRFDDESASFFVATQLAYEKRAEQFPERIKMIESSSDPDAVADNVINHIMQTVGQCK